MKITNSVVSNVKISNLVPPPPVLSYVTSAIYPTLTTDSLQVNAVYPTKGYELSQVVDNASVGQLSVTGADLQSTIAYVSYSESGDSLATGQLSVTGADLQSTIAYVSYSESGDSLATGQLSVTGAVITTTIAYISYTEAEESMAVGQLSILNGSLV